MIPGLKNDLAEILGQVRLERNYWHLISKIKIAKNATQGKE
jgi:hypothetical protein